MMTVTSFLVYTGFERTWLSPVHHASVDVAKEVDILEWYVDGVQPLKRSQNLEGSPEGVTPEDKKREEEQSQGES